MKNKENETIKCPKCESEDIEPRDSWGGFNYYRCLECKNCGHRGNTSVRYEGEEERVEREIIERFLDKENQPDAVQTTLRSHGVIK